MSPTIITEFRFDDVPLRIAAPGCTLKVYGRADIVVSTRGWRVDAVQLFPNAVDRAPTLILPETFEHDLVSIAMDQQVGEAIDAHVTEVVERRGGYMALFGTRMPAEAGFRGRPFDCPDGFGRRAPRTFVL
jgi:predicted dinucleotide-utilizing enzyme